MFCRILLSVDEDIVSLDIPRCVWGWESGGGGCGGGAGGGGGGGVGVGAGGGGGGGVGAWGGEGGLGWLGWGVQRCVQECVERGGWVGRAGGMVRAGPEYAV